MISGIVTTLLLLLFVGLWIWAWQPRLRKGFDDAARLAVDDGIPAGEGIAERDRAGEGRTGNRGGTGA